MVQDIKEFINSNYINKPKVVLFAGLFVLIINVFPMT